MKTDADRRKAAKLRKKKGPLTAEQRTFLTAYEATKKTKRKAASTPAPAVRGPQLTWDRPAPRAVVVHETAAPEGSIDPTANLWSPTMPDAPPDAPPPLPGTPQQPTAGTPLVDAADPATAQPQLGDPHAAEQFAGIVMFVATIGVQNALELASDFAVPPQIAAMVTAENLGKYISFVGESAKRLAIKYNFRGIPMADEAVVGGTIALSVLAFRANTIRKSKQPATKQVTVGVAATAPPANAEQQPVQPKQPDVDMTAGGDLNALWDKK